MLEEAREAFRKHAWATAFSLLLAADQEETLDAEHTVELAQAALLIGKELEGAQFLARAHQAFQTDGAVQPAARCAFWLGFISLLNGETAKAGGWLSRAARLLENHPDCVEQGYLLLPTAYRSFHSGDLASAHSTFSQATAIGERFGDRDLVTLGLQGQGRALVRQGQLVQGLALLDEAMVSVTAGEVSALNAGGVFCSVLDACGEIFDLQRAQEWTSALEKWCESQPDLVPYRGNCLVRRAELSRIHGAWSDALEQAQRASECLSNPAPKAAVGGAFYQMGEVHRLRGSFADAEEAYRQANQWQRIPGPGFAQLRLAQGQVDAASAAIRRTLEDIKEPGPRAVVLDAYVEIMLAAGVVAAARVAADELAAIAGGYDVPFVRALSCRAGGAVLLAEGNAQGALTQLRQSWNIWCELEAPYEAARVRLLLARACQELGDEENALVELTAARGQFQQLGAAVDLARADALLHKPTRPAAGPLTDRELQVLKLVASGLTNRGIAGQLRISEKTVARHLSNIFTKLDLYSRSAATAYAFNHGLV
jgi:DNA-binding CsgD family transcriptional regulator